MYKKKETELGCPLEVSPGMLSLSFRFFAFSSSASLFFSALNFKYLARVPSQFCRGMRRLHITRWISSSRSVLRAFRAQLEAAPDVLCRTYLVAIHSVCLRR